MNSTGRWISAWQDHKLNHAKVAWDTCRYCVDERDSGKSGKKWLYFIDKDNPNRKARRHLTRNGVGPATQGDKTAPEEKKKESK